MAHVIAQLLALNVGSSSVKFALFTVEAGSPRVTARGQIDGLGSHPSVRVADADGRPLLQQRWPDGDAPADPTAALAESFGWITDRLPDLRPDAIGHRIVMGGSEFTGPVLIDDPVLARLDALAPLAPLHQPAGLAGVRLARRLFPRAAQVACFDTAFHRGQPFVHETYALPRRFFDEGVRRYGFHGLSYDYVAGRLAALDPQAAGGRTIVAHLGNGASLCALRAGRSIASSMGFSALDGVPMGTRCGQIDPGVLLWMMQARGMDADAIARVLYRESGLKGLSGESSDLRDLQASGSAAAREAIEHFVVRVRREIGALAALLEGVDAIAFTGGIGEHAADVREAILAGLGWLGVCTSVTAMPATAAALPGERRLTPASSPVSAWVVPTDEELTIARQTLVAAGTDGSLQ